MTRQEYEQKKRECWEEFRKEHPEISCKSLLRNFVDFIFDRAYALGKQEGTSKNSSEINRELSKNSSESNPAEPRFKVGDKVRLKDVYEIEEIDEDRAMVGLKGCAYMEDIDNLEPYTEPKNEVEKMKPIKSYVKVYLATKEEDEEFRTLLYKNGFMWSSGTALISLSNWDSALEASHIHFVYHDKTVTYLGERTKETLTFTEFKKRYFGEDVNLSQETVNCDKQFDNILKDGFSKERRLNIATQMVSAYIHCEGMTDPSYIATVAFQLADALIAESEKEDSK